MKKRKHRSNKKTARRRPASKKIAVIPPRRVGKRSLADLATKINAAHKSVITYMRRGLQDAINTGHLLLEAKARLKHGQWLPWLRKHCEVPERTANHYMRLAEHEVEIETNPKFIADLTITGAIALMAKADEPAEGIAIERIVTSSTVAPACPLEVNVTSRTIAIPVVGYVQPAPEMTDDAKWRFNLNQGGTYLLHIPHTPITTYLHPDVRYSAEQWDQIADFLKKLAAAMRNTVAALDEAVK
jgi:hypothetical protein